MRKEVQRFLAGFSMSGSASLGCVNWQLDPVILGLERYTDFSLEHRIERAVDIMTHMDLLMGRGWDVRTICGSEGYRVILTVEVGQLTMGLTFPSLCHLIIFTDGVFVGPGRL